MKLLRPKEWRRSFFAYCDLRMPNFQIVERCYIDRACLKRWIENAKKQKQKGAPSAAVCPHLSYREVLLMCIVATTPVPWDISTLCHEEEHEHAQDLHESQRRYDRAFGM
jgi:hypothetical protein